MKNVEYNSKKMLSYFSYFPILWLKNGVMARFVS